MLKLQTKTTKRGKNYYSNNQTKQNKQRNKTKTNSLTVVLEIFTKYRVDTNTGPDGAVAKSSANGLVGTRFVSRYWLRPRAGSMGRCKATTPSSFH